MNDAHERRAAVIVISAVLLSVFGLSLGSDEDWHLVVRMLAGLALFSAILLGLGALAAEELGRRIPPKRSLVLGAAAAVGIGVVLLAVLLVAGTLDALGQNDF